MSYSTRQSIKSTLWVVAIVLAYVLLNNYLPGSSSEPGYWSYAGY